MQEVIILGDLEIIPLIKAQVAFEEVLAMEKTSVTRDATTQRFEFTFELAWKTIKRILSYQGVQVRNPRDTIRDAAANGLIKDPKLWFEFLDYRNLTSYTYDESVADKLYAAMP